MHYSTIFFDLDDTLYPHGNGLWDAIGERMNLFMIEKIGLTAMDVPALRTQYFRDYGTTLRGLQLHHSVDSQEYLDYVHDLDLGEFLEPNPLLDEMLSDLKQDCWIFTNADHKHASNVLEILGISSRFQGIIDVTALDFVCKPELESFQRALDIAGCPETSRCVFIDDSVENIQSGVEMGLNSILINKQNTPHKEEYRQMSSILDLPLLMPELWAA
jgi:pyrimidine 5'-nucleotidase